MGKVLLRLLAVFSEYERDLIKERTISGMRRAKAEGKSIGRPRVAFDIAEVLSVVARALADAGCPRLVTNRPGSIIRALGGTP